MIENTDLAMNAIKYFGYCSDASSEYAAGAVNAAIYLLLSQGWTLEQIATYVKQHVVRINLNNIPVNWRFYFR